MENHSDFSREDDQMELPPGFRFHPTDEELITHYLSKKVIENNFNAIAIGEVDFNKVEPWDLPRKAKMGVKEWYFFCMKDRKYPTGLRTNRATKTGYWKATGKDKEIYKAKSLIGMKKTLVFYTGRAPRGEKTNWVMHEYRLDGKYLNLNFSKPSKSEWVLSRVFDKGLTEKKLYHPEFVHLEELHPRSLPPLIDSSSPKNTATKAPIMANMSEDPNATTSTRINPCSSSLIDSNFSVENSVMDHSMEDFQYIDSIFAQDQSILRVLIDGKDSKMNGISSQETGLSGGDINYLDGNGNGPIDLDCLWNYY